MVSYAQEIHMPFNIVNPNHPSIYIKDIEVSSEEIEYLEYTTSSNNNRIVVGTQVYSDWEGWMVGGGDYDSSTFEWKEEWGNYNIIKYYFSSTEGWRRTQDGIQTLFNGSIIILDIIESVWNEIKKTHVVNTRLQQIMHDMITGITRFSQIINYFETGEAAMWGPWNRELNLGDCLSNNQIEHLTQIFSKIQDISAEITEAKYPVDETRTSSEYNLEEWVNMKNNTIVVGTMVGNPVEVFAN